MNRYIKSLITSTDNFHTKIVLPSSNKDNLFMFKNLQNQLIQSIHIAILTKLPKTCVTH